jgi:hypothetical protein
MVSAGCMSATAVPLASLLPNGQTLVSRIRLLLEQRAGHDRQARALAREIVFGASGQSSGKRWSEAQLARTIRANIVADHEAGRVVDMGCLQISATEARALELMRCLSSARVPA